MSSQAFSDAENEKSNNKNNGNENCVENRQKRISYNNKTIFENSMLYFIFLLCCKKIKQKITKRQ